MKYSNSIFDYLTDFLATQWKIRNAGRSSMDITGRRYGPTLPMRYDDDDDE